MLTNLYVKEKTHILYIYIICFFTEWHFCIMNLKCNRHTVKPLRNVWKHISHPFSLKCHRINELICIRVSLVLSCIRCFEHVVIETCILTCVFVTNDKISTPCAQWLFASYFHHCDTLGFVFSPASTLVTLWNSTVNI